VNARAEDVHGERTSAQNLIVECCEAEFFRELILSVLYIPFREATP